MSGRGASGAGGRAARFAWLVAALWLAGTGIARAFPPCGDRDGDGFARPAGCGTIADCNDDAPSSYPGAVEVCDGVDNDCNGYIDDAPSCDTICDEPELIGPSLAVSEDLGMRGGVRGGC